MSGHVCCNQCGGGNTGSVVGQPCASRGCGGVYIDRTGKDRRERAQVAPPASDAPKMTPEHVKQVRIAGLCEELGPAAKQHVTQAADFIEAALMPPRDTAATPQDLPSWLCNKCGRRGEAESREGANRQHQQLSPHCEYFPSWNWTPPAAPDSDEALVEFRGVIGAIVNKLPDADARLEAFERRLVAERHAAPSEPCESYVTFEGVRWCMTHDRRFPDDRATCEAR